MTTETLTIGETITEIRRALKEYIEATYHISHPSLVEQRKQLLEEPGAIYQAPFLESTPRQGGQGTRCPAHPRCRQGTASGDGRTHRTSRPSHP